MASIEKRSRGGRTVWRAHYRSPDGRQRNKTFARKVDAEKFLSNLDTSLNLGTYVDADRGKVTFGAWAQQWLTMQAHLKPTTRSRYEGIVRKHLGVWERWPLGQITHADVQAWASTLTDALQPASLRKVHQVFQLILESAVADGRLARNVARSTKLPRVSAGRHQYLSHAQVDQLARECGYPSTASKHTPHAELASENNRLVVLFLAYTGVRWGEMAALKVGRLDLAKRRALIAEAVTPVQSHGLVWGTPKNHQMREVPIPEFLIAGLELLVEGRERSDLVFQGVRNGGVMRVASFARIFKRAAAVTGLPDLHPHSLRHTAASLAIAAGADVKVVQHMLGHASATMTLDLYGHLFDDRLDEVAQAMNVARNDWKLLAETDSPVAPVLPQRDFEPSTDQARRSEK